MVMKSLRNFVEQDLAANDSLGRFKRRLEGPVFYRKPLTVDLEPLINIIAVQEKPKNGFW